MDAHKGSYLLNLSRMPDTSECYPSSMHGELEDGFIFLIFSSNT